MGIVRAATLGMVGALFWAASAQAKTPRDYMLNPPSAGTFAHLDGYTVGAQASLENRAHLEEGMSMLHTRASVVGSFPYVEGSLNLDMRVFLFTFGGTIAYRRVHRNHTLPAGVANTLDLRNERESDGLQNDQSFPWGEARLRMVVPLDMFFWINTGTLRWEDREDNSFDWFHGMPHDGGMLGRFDSAFLYRHRDFGAIGPYGRYMDLPKDGGREGKLYGGLLFMTRPGFIKAGRDAVDLFLFQTLFTGGDEFGLHGYRIPIYLLAVYRASLRL